MSVHPRNQPLMPPKAPLDVPVQRLDAGPSASIEPDEKRGGSWKWRIAVFTPALAGTSALLAGLFSWLNMGGMTWMEWSLLALIGLSFFWVSLAVATVVVGLAGFAAGRKRNGSVASPLDIALLVPIYNEVPADVFGNAQAMLDDLARRTTKHAFTLYILSDTRDEHIALQEQAAFAALRRDAPPGLSVHYRRRDHNTDRKVGNILDWLAGWGAAHDAMLVLDADSLMAGASIIALSDELSSDPTAGLVQSVPTLIGAETLFARSQAFANIAYGWLLSEGLAAWSRSEGNYWGHNAIIRTKAFASAAALPRMKGDRLILSHDFVEAGMLRRSGWRVRLMPRLSGSYEETPATLIDHVQRDRRWCRGNLQHLRLLTTPGLHPVSRFHLFHGAISYLLSPAWFLLLLAWALLGKNETENVIAYFREESPLYPDWPVMTEINSALFLAIMYAVLLTPKLTGAAVIALHPKAHKTFGGRGRFLVAVITELLISIAYAPVMMIQQCRAVVHALISKSDRWTPTSRVGGRFGFHTLLRFHWIETLLGALLIMGLALDVISPWLLPIVLSLALAVPLSALSGLNLLRHAPKPLQLDNPTTLREPAIVTRARAERGRFKSLLEGQISTPAE
ncbi:MAG: glucans biosynthesis glucosyltransferase MdoH [Pseudomonadota bacterium]